MQVVVGPVSARSMGAFAEFARDVLRSPGPGEDVPGDAALAFEGYLDEWSERGDHDGEETWTTTAEPEVIEYLVHAFHRVTREVNDAAGDAQVVPDEASAFYWLLVGGLLDSLAAEGGARAEFAAHLREFWPGDHEVP